MVIETSSAKFLIESANFKDDLVKIYCNSSAELERFFGSQNVTAHFNPEFLFQVSVSKQEFSNALIIMVKEMDNFDQPISAL